MSGCWLDFERRLWLWERGLRMCGGGIEVAVGEDALGWHIGISYISQV